MFPAGLIFVSQPTAFRWDQLDLWKQAGFEGFALRTQHGQRLVENWDEVAAFRDRARASGFYCATWVDLEVDGGAFDYQQAGEVAASASVGFDGDVVDAEAISLQRLGPFLVGYHPYRKAAVSTLCTFECGNLVAELDRRRWFLLQQAYRIENGWTVEGAVRWALGPPLWVGWWIRARIKGKGRRGQIVSPTAFQTFEGLYALDPSTRNLFRTPRKATSKPIGVLEGLWHPDRIVPTVRTTPVGGRELEPAQCRADVAATPGKPRIGAYLGETTPETFLTGYRPA